MKNEKYWACQTHMGPVQFAHTVLPESPPAPTQSRGGGGGGRGDSCHSSLPACPKFYRSIYSVYCTDISGQGYKGSYKLWTKYINTWQKKQKQSCPNICHNFALICPNFAHIQPEFAQILPEYCPNWIHCTIFPLPPPPPHPPPVSYAYDDEQTYLQTRDGIQRQLQAKQCNLLKPYNVVYVSLISHCCPLKISL